ncbi:hypothetical protein [Pseudoduganella lutea]|uniref:Uncharacterized protein n=1 Tax=Pseudoduganella lutea TaxID=321985 RepID=A0A4P6L5G7_9BURK|nr:hypothetical protein [Pseudoduganella lutea]QBE66704.1 hypothetical protein EWM63_30145 [Pseudoduganella lutea]
MHVWKTITPPFVKKIFDCMSATIRSQKLAAVTLEPHIVTLDVETQMQRYLNPEYVQGAGGLVQSHPKGSERDDVRLSGNFLDKVKYCGTYFGIAPQQGLKQASMLSKIGRFGVDAELGHYTQMVDPATGECDLQRGVRVHGDRRMANGRVNPVLGAGAKYVVTYEVVKAARFLYMDFTDPEFRNIVDELGRDADIAHELPCYMTLSDLCESDEAKADQLLHRSMAAALYEVRHLLKLDGVILRSARGRADTRTTDSAIICYWSDDGAVLDWIRPRRIDFFDYAEDLPRMVAVQVDALTDYRNLRETARKADKR